MITPSDTPSAPELYGAVPVQGMNIQAPQDEAAITAAMELLDLLPFFGGLFIGNAASGFKAIAPLSLGRANIFLQAAFVGQQVQVFLVPGRRAARRLTPVAARNVTRPGGILTGRAVRTAVPDHREVIPAAINPGLIRASAVRPCVPGSWRPV